MATGSKICNVLQGAKPTLLMVTVQAILGLVNITYKLAINDGMPVQVLVAYRFMFAAAIICPVAFFVERKKRPKITKRIVFEGFLCGLFGGALGQNLYLKSVALTSATFTSAMTNLVPAITFIVAVCLRLERLGWNTAAGKAKVFGTILGLGGATVITLYKGPELNIWHSNLNLLELTSTHPHPKDQAPHQSGGHDLILGAILAVASCVCYSLWLIVQAKSAVKFPCPYSITAFMTLSSSIQGTMFALCTERDWSKWILGWDIRLLTVAYSGVVGSALMFTLIAWCVKMKGPLFVSVFNPLLLVIVAIVGSLVLEEKLHLGMILGAILIVAGLYTVLWGKGKEAKKVSQLMPDTPANELPLPPASAAVVAQSESNHGGSSRKEEEEREEDRRDSQASAEVLGAIYIVH